MPEYTINKFEIQPQPIFMIPPTRAGPGEKRHPWPVPWLILNVNESQKMFGTCFSPPVTFNNVFDEYNQTSNFFTNSKPYALTVHKSKMLQQNASHLVKHIRIRGKNLSKKCLTIVQKAQNGNCICKFSKII